MKSPLPYTRSGSCLAVLLLSSTISVSAQTNPVYLSGPVSIGKTDTVRFYGDLEIGSAAKLYAADGSATFLYGVSTKIDLGAQFYGVNAAWSLFSPGTGSGRMVFKQPNPLTGTTQQQQLDGGNNLPYPVPSIEIYNPQGVKLVSNATYIGTNILFSSGHLVLDTSNIVLGENATLTGYDATRYVVTADKGHLVKIAPAIGVPFTFPVGHGINDYTPAMLTPQSNGVIAVNVTDSAGAAGKLHGTDGMNRAWNIYAESPVTADIALQHNSLTNQPAWNVSANFETQYGVNPNLSGDMTSGVLSPWQSNIPSASSTAGGAGTETQSRTYTLATSATANESWYSKASSLITPLPLWLLSFSAVSSDCNALLRWTTGGFDDGHGSVFLVERSIDGGSFNTIARLSAAQNTSDYSYLDPDAGLQGVNRYYRLRLQHADGTFSYSQTQVAAACNSLQGGQSFTIQPNPANNGGSITIVYTGTETNACYVITNVQGSLLQRSQLFAIGGKAGNTQQVQLMQSIPGIYLITLTGADGQVLGHTKLVIR